MSIDQSLIGEVRRYRRQVVGEFMDAYPGKFPPPVTESSWVAYFERVDAVCESERLLVEKALWLFTQIFRSQQNELLIDEPIRLEEFMSIENIPGIEEVVPDPVALFIVGGEDSTQHTPEQVAYARSITVFKFLVHTGKLPVDYMYKAACDKFDNFRCDSALQRSLVDAVKKMAQRDMEILLGNTMM